MSTLRNFKNLLVTIKDAEKRRGLFFILYHFPKAFYYTYFKKQKTFVFRGLTHDYFYHLYNYTHLNERAIEIPIFLKIIKEHQGKRILEVGNVLSHYVYYQHDILDKYEKGKNVINKDVVDFHPKEKYDLILSISTLEHVGLDENVKDSGKTLLAVQSLKNCLVSGGKMIITLPFGYNAELDKLLDSNKFNFINRHYFKKNQSNNEWKEVKAEDAIKTEYDNCLHSANGLFFGVIENK